MPSRRMSPHYHRLLPAVRADKSYLYSREMFEKSMLIKPDERQGYGEAAGILAWVASKRRFTVVVSTECQPDIIRIISLRRANKREQARLEDAIADRLDTPQRHITEIHRSTERGTKNPYAGNQKKSRGLNHV